MEHHDGHGSAAAGERLAGEESADNHRALD